VCCDCLCCGASSLGWSCGGASIHRSLDPCRPPRIRCLCSHRRAWGRGLTCRGCTAVETSVVASEEEVDVVVVAIDRCLLLVCEAPEILSVGSYVASVLSTATTRLIVDNGQQPSPYHSTEDSDRFPLFTVAQTHY